MSVILTPSPARLPHFRHLSPKFISVYKKLLRGDIRYLSSNQVHKARRQHQFVFKMCRAPALTAWSCVRISDCQSRQPILSLAALSHCPPEPESEPGPEIRALKDGWGMGSRCHSEGRLAPWQTSPPVRRPALRSAIHHHQQQLTQIKIVPQSPWQPRVPAWRGPV